MSEEHTALELTFDRELLEDVFDMPDLRYVLLYMFIVRKELFQDLIDDDLMESFDLVMDLEEPDCGDLRRYCSSDLIKNFFQYHVVSNIRSYSAFLMKGDHVKLRLSPGIRLVHEEIDELEEEVHIFLKETYLERLITAAIPEMTQIRIHAALERLRAMMCPKTPVMHTLVHKYGEEWVLNDDLYYLIEELGNPFQALRIELMIRAMSVKYREVEVELDGILAQFDPNLPKAKWMGKLRKVPTTTLGTTSDYVAYLAKKSRKSTLPIKFRVEFPPKEIPDLYSQWKLAVNTLIGLKLQFDAIDQKMNDLRAYYSGKNQVMPYLTFIEKTTYDDVLADRVKSLLLEARNALKTIKQGASVYPKKEMKLLNLTIERLIIDEGLDDDDD